MIKKIVFDMDGTIADLYHVKNWEEQLRDEQVEPYLQAKPLCDMRALNKHLHVLKDNGYTIAIVTWTAKNGNADFNQRIRKAKRLWLKRYEFPFDEFHAVKYGTPKHRVVKEGILVDDDNGVRQAWERTGRKAIDAKENILLFLQNLAYQEAVGA